MIQTISNTLDPFNHYNTTRSVREINLKTLRKTLAEESKKMSDYKGTREETKEILSSLDSILKSLNETKSIMKFNKIVI